MSPLILANAPRRLPRMLRSIDIAPLCMELLGLETGAVRSKLSTPAR